MDGALFPAVPVPLTAGGRTHVQAQEAYVRHMAAQPVAGAAFWTHIGRGLMLEPGHCMAVMRSWRVGMNDGRWLVAGVGSRSEPGGTRGQRFSAAVHMGEEAL